MYPDIFLHSLRCKRAIKYDKSSVLLVDPSGYRYSLYPIQMDTSRYMFYSWIQVDSTGYNLYPVESIQVQTHLSDYWNCWLCYDQYDPDKGGGDRTSA